MDTFGRVERSPIVNAVRGFKSPDFPIHLQMVRVPSAVFPETGPEAGRGSHQKPTKQVAGKRETG